jgi:aspartate kinase
LIVMKFGGSSVADAERIKAAAKIVGDRRERSPVVVVSALAGVTDLLVDAVGAACAGERERVDRLLADLERRHRWALAGAVEDSSRRHHLSLEVDGLFEELRQRIRSIRILGEGSPRAADAVMAHGEMLSARIVAAAFKDLGLPCRWVDSRDVVITSERFGDAEPDFSVVTQRAGEILGAAVAGGEIPVLGGFVGATPKGDTTTLGRGGSDTSAALLGSAMGAEEIQIWTDVDGLMSADPALVPGARTLPRVSFAEAAELAFYGARVLHPDSIHSAVKRRIPVRVMNSLRPEGKGTLIVESGADAAEGSLASVASRAGVYVARVTNRRLRVDGDFIARVVRAFGDGGMESDLVLSSELAICLVLPSEPQLEEVERVLGEGARIDVESERAIICVVGSGLQHNGRFRALVLSALAEFEPEMVALGASRASLAAIVRQEHLADAVRGLHARFVEEVE